MTSHTRSSAAEPRSPGAHERIWGARIGWLVDLGPEGQPRVAFEGSPAGALVARLACALEGEALRSATERRQRVVLLFENGDPGLPLIVGLERVASPTPLLDALLEGEAQVAEAPGSPPVEAHVDGRRVVIEGADEIVLRCGQASITLRRNGKVVLKGTYIETHASGVNRIKGGSVQVN